MKQSASQYKSKSSSKLGSLLANRLIKVVLIIMFAVAIYYQVISKENIQDLWIQFVSQMRSGNIWLILSAVILMPINWALETKKWQHLTSKFQKISFIKAYTGILCGLSIGILTPQRIGEYGGRILTLENKNNWRGILATFISSISQNLMNVSIGLICASIFIISYLDMPKYVIISFLMFSIAIISISFFFYYNLDLFVKFLRKLPFIKNNEKFKKLSTKKNIYTFQDLSNLNAYSLLRYGVYLGQYILLLYFFGISTSVATLMIGVSTIYLLQSSIPIPPMFGFLARGEIALIIWGVFSANQLSILSATFALWIINLLIPSFLGLLIVLNINVLQSLHSESH